MAIFVWLLEYGLQHPMKMAISPYLPGVSKKYGVENYNILLMVQYINLIF